MPSQSEVKWSQLKVGVIVAISLVMLVTLLFLITSSQGLGLFSHKIGVVTYLKMPQALRMVQPSTWRASPSAPCKKSR